MTQLTKQLITAQRDYIEHSNLSLNKDTLCKYKEWCKRLEEIQEKLKELKGEENGQ